MAREKIPKGPTVTIEYVGGGPCDGKIYVLRETEIPESKEPPYREEQIGNRIHVYAAESAFKLGTKRIRLKYVGFIDARKK